MEKVPGRKPWQVVKNAARANVGAFDDDVAERAIGKLLKSCHPKQRAFVVDTGRRVCALTARGAGKTTAELARMLIKMLRVPKARCVFIATTREAARLLIWEKLKDVCEKIGVETDFKEVRLECRLARNGSMLRLVGADDMREIEKLRGQSFHEVGIDEAASHPARLLEHLIDRIIGPRLGNYDGAIALFGTPGHHLQGPFYDATRAGSDFHRPYEERDKPEYADWQSWSSHTWNLSDGAPHVVDLAKLWDAALVEKRVKQWSDDHPVWRREYLGQWSADDTDTVFKYRAFLEDGTPWNQWDPEREGPYRVAKLPEGRKDWLWGYGMDYGSVDKTTLHAFAFSPTDPTRTIYHCYEFGASDMYVEKIAKLLIGEDLNADKPDGLIGATGYPAGIVADMAGAGDIIISELSRVYGIQIAAVEKKRNEKFATIELMNGDLLDGRMKILKGSQLETQMIALQWKTDEFGQVSEHKGQANDHTDAAIYARRLIAVLFEREGPAPTKPRDGVQRAPQAPDQVEAPRTEFTEMLGLGDSEGFGDLWGND